MSQSKFKVIENNSMDKENRNKSLEVAVGLIEKNFGKGSIMKLGSKANIDIESISTGSLGLDIALGIGGVPKGRIVEIYGPESSGKTTLALHIVAEAQKKDGNCAFIDAEHALDPIYAKKLGVKLEELLISQPDTGEQGLEIADTLVKSGGVDVLVIDSVAALVPRAELEGEMGDSLKIEAEQLNIEQEKVIEETDEKITEDNKIPFIPYHLLNQASVQRGLPAFITVCFLGVFLYTIFTSSQGVDIQYLLEPRIVRSKDINNEKPIVELNDGRISIAIDGSVSGLKMKLQDLAGNILFSSDIEDLESSDGKIYIMDLSTIDFKRNQYDLIIYKDTGSNFKKLLYDSKITIKR